MPPVRIELTTSGLLLNRSRVHAGWGLDYETCALPTELKGPCAYHYTVEGDNVASHRESGVEPNV